MINRKQFKGVVVALMDVPPHHFSKGGSIILIDSLLNKLSSLSRIEHISVARILDPSQCTF